MGAHAAACELITILERRGGGGRAVLELMRVVQNGSGCGKVPPVCSSGIRQVTIQTESKAIVVRTNHASMELRKCICFSSVHDSSLGLLGTCESIPTDLQPQNRNALFFSPGFPRNEEIVCCLAGLNAKKSKIFLF
ncbi:hypothetical protein V6N13_032532 [Hibiscus sabdariffa]